MAGHWRDWHCRCTQSLIGSKQICCIAAIHRIHWRGLHNNNAWSLTLFDSSRSRPPSSLFCELGNAQEHLHLLQNIGGVASHHAVVAWHFGHRHTENLDNGRSAGGAICGCTMHPARSSSPIRDERAVEVRNPFGSDDGRELRIAATADGAVGKGILGDLPNRAPPAALGKWRHSNR